MKKILVKISVLLLALALVLVGFAGCAASGKTLLKYKEYSLSVNLYELFLTRLKGKLATVGNSVGKDSFWDATVDMNGTTNNEYYTSLVLNNAKSWVVGMALFDEYKLVLPQSYIKDTDEYLSDLMESYAGGSKSQFNAILAEYGVNYDMLREAYIIEDKINYLQEYLYSRASTQVKEDYYQEHYVRFKQIFLASYYYDYEKDSNGDDIYFKSDGKIAYDTKNGHTMRDVSGNLIIDENGDWVYFLDSGKIAYDTQNGSPAFKFDKDGNYAIYDYTEEELEEILADANEMVTAVGNDVEKFENVMEEYSQDAEGQTDSPNGYFLNVDTDYDYAYLNDIKNELKSMDKNDVKIVESDYGYHIIMKYELESGGYSDEENAVWFEDFNSSLSGELFQNKISPLIGDVEINMERLSDCDIKSVGVNTAF